LQHETTNTLLELRQNPSKLNLSQIARAARWRTIQYAKDAFAEAAADVKSPGTTSSKMVAESCPASRRVGKSRSKKATC
jgi:hypothetical protein